ncbi:hypothetical protein Syun_012773 [Stephania yunnanensis]|uniref:Uncharacterized protein n=1 Tax=Stephania yunnanensis TaxID=152371 RepID=A0AAP0K1F4_9MAGN
MAIFVLDPPCIAISGVEIAATNAIINDGSLRVDLSPGVSMALAIRALVPC